MNACILRARKYTPLACRIRVPLPSGIYFLRLKTCGEQVTSKAVHLK